MKKNTPTENKNISDTTTDTPAEVINVTGDPSSPLKIRSLASPFATPGRVIEPSADKDQLKIHSIYNAREALAMTVENVLGRQFLYAVVTYDSRGKLVIFKVRDDSPVLDAVISAKYFGGSLVPRYGYEFTSTLKQAEKRRTAVIRRLQSQTGTDEEFDRTDPMFWMRDVRCVELVTIVKISSAAVAVHPVKKVKVSK